MAGTRGGERGADGAGVWPRAGLQGGRVFMEQRDCLQASVENRRMCKVMSSWRGSKGPRDGHCPWLCRSGLV